MTAQRVALLSSGGRLAVQSFHFADLHTSELCVGPAVHKRGGAHQIIGNDPEANPPSRAVRTSIATAPQSMSSFDHADATFTTDTPPLAAAKPSLALMSTPRRCFPTGSGQDHPTHAARGRGLFVRRRRESAISGGDIRWPLKHRDMSIQRRRPQCYVGGGRPGRPISLASKRWQSDST
jgi:hypothetical protein